MKVAEGGIKAVLETLISPRYLPLYLIFLLAILTLFKVHGSSVGMYNKYFYGEGYIDKNLILGTPRGIRSDEWLVLTPLTIAQAENNFAHINKNIGLGQEMSVSYDAPTRHWSTFFKPYDWAFFVAPLENAFAFKWWFRGAALIISMYLLVLTLSKGNRFLSISSSLLLFLTPFVQWWYSTPVLEIIIFGLFIIYFLIRIFHFKGKIGLLMNSLLLAYFSICYAFTPYPPFQITIGLFILCFLIGYTLDNIRTINRDRAKAYFISGGAALSVIVGFLLAYYTSFRDVIQIMLNTSYPGERMVAGGGYHPARFFSGFFNIQLLDDLKTVPQILGNQSEASSFFMLSIFILPMVLFYLIRRFSKDRKVDFVLLSISSYLILATLWIFVGLPKPLPTLLLLNQIPHNRMIIGIGVANLLLIIYWLCCVKIPRTLDYRIASVLIALFGFLAHLYLGICLKSNHPAFISNDLKILLISGFASSSILLLLLQKQKLFILSLLLYAIISTLSVNPLYRGLDPLINSELSRQVQQIEKANTNKDRWVVYDSIILGDYLVANGANSLNGTHLYPQPELWKEFDPQGRYYPIYNRYAHIVFKTNKDENEILFSLDQPDTFSVKINPCNGVFKTLNVGYFVFNSKVDYKCFSEVAEVPYPSMPVYIFKRL